MGQHIWNKLQNGEQFYNSTRFKTYINAGYKSHIMQNWSLNPDRFNKIKKKKKGKRTPKSILKIFSRKGDSDLSQTVLLLFFSEVSGALPLTPSDWSEIIFQFHWYWPCPCSLHRVMNLIWGPMFSLKEWPSAQILPWSFSKAFWSSFNKLISINAMIQPD